MPRSEFGGNLAKKIPLLEQMRRNPRADWDIDDVAKLCAEHDIELEPPSSHYKAISHHLQGTRRFPQGDLSRQYTFDPLYR